jgi:hypothetical protein
METKLDILNELNVLIQSMDEIVIPNYYDLLDSDIPVSDMVNLLHSELIREKNPIYMKIQLMEYFLQHNN